MFEYTVVKRAQFVKIIFFIGLKLMMDVSSFSYNVTTMAQMYLFHYHYKYSQIVCQTKDIFYVFRLFIFQFNSPLYCYVGDGRVTTLI